LPYLTYCLDTDEGIGIIDTAYQETNQLQINPFQIPYKQFEQDRNWLLQLMDPGELEEWIYYFAEV
jgi:hypothetical protein